MKFYKNLQIYLFYKLESLWTEASIILNLSFFESSVHLQHEAPNVT
jgi:hypothetical protein